MFENSNLRINGTKWLPEVRTVDHWEYIKLMSLYSEISRKSLFNRAGYRQDEMGKTEYTNVELDPNMCCECLMYLIMNIFCFTIFWNIFQESVPF